MKDIVEIELDYDELKNRVNSKGASAQSNQVGGGELYKYGSGIEKFGVFIAILCALAQGCSMPIFMIFMGNVLNNFGAENKDGVQSFDKDAIFEGIYAMLIVAGASFVVAFGMNTILSITASSITTKIRKLYLKAALSQEMGWYDSKKSGEITDRFGSGLELIQEGIGPKLGLAVSAFSMFLAGWIIGFIKGWRLSLVVLGVIPLLLVDGMVMSYYMQKLTIKTSELSAKAGGIAEEFIVSIRTVTSLNCQKFSHQRH